MRRGSLGALVGLVALATDCRPKDAETPRAQALSRRASESPKSARPPPRRGHPPLATSPAGLLRAGAVTSIQEALRRHGYEVRRSGELDEQTSDALRAFQSSRELAATGAPDQETLEQLGLHAPDLLRRNP